MILRPHDIDADFCAATQPWLFRPGSRGAGFYLWKPWVVHYALESIHEGEFLLYADAGCRVSTSLDAFHSWFEDLKGPRCILLHKMTPNAEHRWTTQAAARAIGATEEDMLSPQRAATYLLLRKCAESSAFIDAWMHFAKTRPDLFSDAYDAETRRSDMKFIDHRWDQSILSLLSKQPLFSPYIALREFSSNEPPIWHSRLR